MLTVISSGQIVQFQRLHEIVVRTYSYLTIIGDRSHGIRYGAGQSGDAICRHRRIVRHLHSWSALRIIMEFANQFSRVRPPTSTRFLVYLLCYLAAQIISSRH